MTFVKRTEVRSRWSVLKPRQAEVTGKSDVWRLVPLVDVTWTPPGGVEATPEAHLLPKAFFLQLC